jgi:signal transduction histidine kinase
VSIRSKLLAVILVFGIAPMLVISILNYMRGVSAVEAVLREDIKMSAQQMASNAEGILRDANTDLLELAQTPALRDYLRATSTKKAATSGGSVKATTNGGDVGASPAAASVVGRDASSASDSAPSSVPPEVWAEMRAFYLSHAKMCPALTLLDAERRPLLRVEGVPGESDRKEARWQTTADIVTGSVRADDGVWTAPPDAGALRSPITGEDYGASQRLTVPVFLDASKTGQRGALVAEIELEGVLRQAEAGYAPLKAGAGSSHGDDAARPARIVVALDRNVVLDNRWHPIYQTSTSFDLQRPFFTSIAQKMKAGEDDADFYDDRAADGDRWLAAFRRVGETGLSVAVMVNYSESVKSLRRAGMSGVALLLLAALVATLLLVMLVSRTVQRIERVGAAAAAIAGGDLNQRIEIHTHDEMQVLADSFNRMTDRLSEQITREAETRQFESFMRLSAMLTHDLKNSITALSILVSNMERQFHREEFRADAILSLREATEKLTRIVSRLSEPVKSLSGEYRRDARPTDIIPVIRRVIATTAEPSVPLYKIETRLPDKLVAYVEAGRIENVIENLIINALEAMGAKGGRLTVEAGAEANGTIFFSVADTGSGMSEEFLQKRLFRPFSTTKTKGIGLGLYTCREIIEAHGGRLDVESKVGVGTRFRAVLPSKPFTPRERHTQSSTSHKAAITSGRG